MSKKIIVFGAGLVGSAIALDLARNGNRVTTVDIDETALLPLEGKHGIVVEKADFMEAGKLQSLLQGQDLAVGAAPGSLGYRLMESVIRNGIDMVDISFCLEDFLELDPLAREKGVTVIADMGVAPGMCNAILGYHDNLMKVESYKCIVGGLPEKRTWPLEYKASWSPIDCIEEYTRPARLMQQGRIVTRPALSDAELVEFEEVGTLEEWNSDGLRSLLTTMSHVPDMVEKTLRYPGTINYVKALRELGFFSGKEVEVNGKMIKPIDLTAKLLFPAWKLDEGEGEFTIMRINIEGNDQDRRRAFQYDLVDRYDKDTDTLSMARTTGYTCSAAATLILNGIVKEKGVLAPERVGGDKTRFDFLLKYLGDRGVNYRSREL